MDERAFVNTGLPGSGDVTFAEEREHVSNCNF
jgi:hypothetical protein